MDNVETDFVITLELDPIDRWTVFERLQALSIPCHCAQGQPLRAEVATATAALQIWSVLQQVLRPRQELASRLSHCWRQPVQ